MAPKKVNRGTKKVKTLGAKRLTGAHSKGVKGGAVKGKEKWSM